MTTNTKAQAVYDLAGQDHPRHVLTLLSPRHCRADLATLYAFNLELSQIRDRVSEAIIGHMRVQFWRDALDPMIAGKPPAQPIAQALSQVIRKHNLAETGLRQMIDCRDAEIAGAALWTLDDAVAEARAKSGQLHRLAADMLCSGADAKTLDAAEAAGTAWGLIGMMRSVPFEASEGRCRLPADLCRTFNLAPESVARPTMAEARSKVLEKMGEHASELLKGSAKGWDKRATASVLIGYLAKRLLSDMAEAGFDPFAETLTHLTQGHRLSPGAMTGLLWRSWFGRL